MIKSWMRDLALAIQAKTGATPALLVWLAVVLLASLTAFAFLCVAGYDWLALQFGGIFAGLMVAGFFLLIAASAAMLAALARRHAKKRAILERAARAHPASWLLDPKIVSAAVNIGRAIGWQRLLPIALLGFVAAQWARDQRDRGGAD
jgi:hypothetical protein